MVYTLPFLTNVVIAPKLETSRAFIFLIYIKFPTRCNFSFWKIINPDVCNMQKKIRNLKIMYLKSNSCLLLLDFSSSLGGMLGCSKHRFHTLSIFPGPLACYFCLCPNTNLYLPLKNGTLSQKGKMHWLSVNDCGVQRAPLAGGLTPLPIPVDTAGSRVSRAGRTIPLDHKTREPAPFLALKRTQEWVSPLLHQEWNMYKQGQLLHQLALMSQW